MKKGFTLPEVMIAVAILGILAAVAYPTFQDYQTTAKEAAAKDTLRIVRNAIGIYAARHNDVAPGYLNDDPTKTPSFTIFLFQLISKGRYLSDIPVNPFNNLKTTKVLANNGNFSVSATGEFGWIYKPATKEFRIDRPGKDSKGISFYDY